MGLDMYIKRVKRTDHTVKFLEAVDNEENLKPESEAAQPFLPLYKYDFGEYYSIFHEACYWRKFNALHNWFVVNIQDGVDDCGSYEIQIENLNDCINTLKEVAKTKNHKLLEPKSGFFFGPTAIDDYYWQSIDNAIDQLEKLRDFDWNDNRFFYRSSW